MSLSLANYNLESKDKNGNTILHTAIYKRNWSIIHRLLNYIFDNDEICALNTQNEDGDTPLHIAVRRLPLNQLSCTLIKMGARTDIPNKCGETIEIAETIGEYFEYVKNDLDLSDLEDDEEVNENVSPTTITIINIMPVPEPKRIKQFSSKKQTDSIVFPSSMTFENVSPVSPSLVSQSPVVPSLVVSSPVVPSPVSPTPIVPSLVTPTLAQTPAQTVSPSPSLTPSLTTEKEIGDMLKKQSNPSQQAVSSFINNLLKQN
jgi:hypothetical protein